MRTDVNAWPLQNRPSRARPRGRRSPRQPAKERPRGPVGCCSCRYSSIGALHPKRDRKVPRCGDRREGLFSASCLKRHPVGLRSSFAIPRIGHSITGGPALDPLRRVTSILCGCVAFAALLWGARCFQDAASKTEQARAEEDQAWRERKKSLQVFADDLKKRERRVQQATEIERLENQPPRIADKPPFPRIEIDANPFNLGIIAVGKPGSHKFKIKNVGQAPLVIFQPNYGCHRSPPAVQPRKEVPPGASAEIEVNFTLCEATPAYAKTIALWTNDPAHREVVLKIYGIAPKPKGRSRP
jgi:Protein of unknown function (DUF1573)